MAMVVAPVHSTRLQLMMIRLRIEQQLLLSVVAAAVLRRRHQRQGRRKRQFWVRPWIGRRLYYGNYTNLMRELEQESHGDFTNYMRMEPRMFHELLIRLSPRLTKQDTKFRRPLEPGLKLAIALRYMASGNKLKLKNLNFKL